MFYTILWLLEQILYFLAITVPLLLAVAYFTLAERKIMAAMQRRFGPNVVGYAGLLQAMADGVKLLTKQTVIPTKSNRKLFLFAPVYSFALSLAAWAVIPFDYGVVVADIDVGLLYLLAISTLNVYGIIIAGWSSNSKYAFLGACRAAAQMISYDVSMGLILLTIVLSVGSCNLTQIVLAQNSMWFIGPFLPLAVMFFISALAETNRAPFDLTEAEAELVAGYNVEYSAVGFALFFLAEYANMLLMCALTVILFFGGWQSFFYTFLTSHSTYWLGLKTSMMAFLMIWVRGTFPRYRYDQLMLLGWKVFLPLSFSWFIFFAFIFNA
jgi:NADH-quinone oxidoreductase subunit H